jgi:hypothetical protein
MPNPAENDVSQLPTDQEALPPVPSADSHEAKPAAPGEIPATVDPYATMPFTLDRTGLSNVPSADIPAPPGYEIIGELGRGGMGVVYKARQPSLGRVVALKMILAGGHAGSAGLARFQSEAKAIARLQHPNVVAVYEVGEHEGKPFFSLEYCDGGSLDRQLGGIPIPPEKAAKLVQTLALAMQAAHDAHVIHRDLKPANVLLASSSSTGDSVDSTPKITDFGLAKRLDEAGQTHTGQVMGTPSYMAPEQAEGKKDIGPAADIYALGAILYECLTGRPPFRAATTIDTIMQVLADSPVSPRQLNAKVPKDLETICLKCLEKQPHHRYTSAAVLASDLHHFLAGEPIEARPAGQLERVVKWVKRRPAAAALVAACLLGVPGLVVLSVVAVSQWRNAVAALERERTTNREREIAKKKQEATQEATERFLASLRKRQDLSEWAVLNAIRSFEKANPDLDASARKAFTESLPLANRFRSVGAGACAAEGCHGKAIPTPELRGTVPISRYSHTVWSQRDRHARAHDSLLTERARLIEQNLLGLTDASQAEPQKNDFCISCHSPAQNLPLVLRSTGGVLEQGVGCEACHGRAERWLEPHASRSASGEWFPPEKSSREKASIGFIDNRLLILKAEGCVRCHVGSSNIDVNHDLLAAGHPWRPFEFTSHLARMEKHWAGRNNSGAHVWAVGQLVSARAALELLAYRANPRNNRPWPEFSEYNCSSCHHGLPGASWRLERAVWRSKSGQRDVRAPGEPHFSRWYLGVLYPYADQVPTDPILVKTIYELEVVMGHVNPLRQDAMKLADRCRSLLQSSAEALGRGRLLTFHAVRMSLGRQLARSGAAQFRTPEGSYDWEYGEQLALGLTAMSEGDITLEAQARELLGKFTGLGRSKGNRTSHSLERPLRDEVKSVQARDMERAFERLKVAFERQAAELPKR